MPRCVDTPRVLVVMATYNGERYLKEQIDSILTQKGVKVSLLISDDCSQDGTVDVASEYASRDSRVSIRMNASNVGVALNFMSPVYEADTRGFDFLAFSDQDDVWLPEKLIHAIRKIAEVERSEDAVRFDDLGAPVLYCSDLQNTDEHLNHPKRELANLGFDPSKGTTTILRNYYSGCTMVMNVSMVRLLQERPIGAFPRIHDVWCALVAQFCGNFCFDSESARILRRITGQNAEGALLRGGDVQSASIKRAFSCSEHSSLKTARLLLGAYSYRMSEESRLILESFVSYKDSFGSRVKWSLRMDYRASGFVDTALMRLKLLLGRY